MTTRRTRPGLTLLLTCRPSRNVLLRVFGWTALEALPSTVSGLAVGRAVDAVRSGAGAHAIWWLVGLAVAIVANAVATRRLYVALAPAVEGVRDGLTAAVVRGSLAELADTGRPGSAPLTQVIDQIDQVRNLLSAVARSLRTTVVPIVAALVGMSVLDPVLALIVVVPLLLAVPAYALLVRAMVHAQRDAALADEVLGETAAATLADPAVLRGLGAEHAAASCVAAAAEATGRADIRVARLNARRHLVLAIGGYAPLLALVAVSGPLLHHGRISVGDIVGATTYVLTALIPALSASMSGAGGWLVQLAVLLDRLAAVADRRDPAAVAPRQGRAAAVSARGLTFAYRDGARPIITALDLDIAAGEMVVLVGPSGAGKTTFAHLCAGLIDPSAGTVSVGGRLVLLPQQPYVVAGTYRENVLYLSGDSPPSDEKLREVLSAVGLAPASLDDAVAGLGAGDAQRLVLARALLSEGDVLVVDEGWSLLDAAERHRIEQVLRQGDRTLVVVSHHLDIAPRADRVIYFDGRDIAIGRHDELVATSSAYRELVAYAAVVPEFVRD